MSLSFPTKAAGVGALAGLALSGFLYASLAPGIQPAAATTPVKTVATAEPVVLLRDCPAARRCAGSHRELDERDRGDDRHRRQDHRGAGRPRIRA